MKKLYIVLFILAGVLISPGFVFSQSALGQLEQAAGRSIGSVRVPAVSGPSRVGGAASALGGVMPSSSSVISNAVAGAVMQGLINNILSPTPAKSQAEIDAEKAEADRIALEAEKLRLEEAARQQELHDNLMNSSKSLSGSESLDFKSLDGDMETMRKQAADQFEPKPTGNTLNSPSSGNTLNTPTGGNNFFGEPVSEVDFQTLVEPESNAVYLDIKTAVASTDEYFENEKLAVKIIGQALSENRGEPIIEKPDCKALNEKLTRYRSDMVRFHAWNSATLTELEKWEKQNNDAFWNAVTDGASSAFGVFLDYLDDTRSSATRIKKVLETNEAKYLKDKVFTPEDIIKYKKLLDQRITLCNVTQLAKETMKPWDYVNLARNLLQGTTEKLSKSDGECMKIIDVLKEEELLSGTPWVDAGQFLTGAIINKFMDDPSVLIKPNSLIKGALKVPYVTIAQLAVDEAYNITDMLTSFANITTLRDADGKASEAVKKIQTDMDNIKIQLKNCPAAN